MKTHLPTAALAAALFLLVHPQSSANVAATRERPASPSTWKLTPAPQSWSAEGFAEALDLSGIAAVGNGHCLVASDELAAVQVGRIDRRRGRLAAGVMVSLAGSPTGKPPEIDIEGVAATPDGKKYYVTGSHGVGKKKGDVQPTRFAVYELPVDPKTGEIRRSGIRQASLQSWFERSAEFGSHLYRPLQLNGVNIEGLAYAKGRLYFGLRGPNLDGHGFVIETEAKALFGGEPVDGRLHKLPLGEGRGVRDLVACRDGFLMLVGNASAEPTKKFPVSQAREPDARFQLAWWAPGESPALVWLGELPHGMGKAEALLVLEDTPDAIEVLILHDGAPDGGPVAYRLSRPTLTDATVSR